MKILIIKTSSMGDVIHALPAVTDAIASIPNLSIDWVVEKSFAEIPSWHSNVNEVIPVSLRKWRKQPITAYRTGEFHNFKKQIQANSYDYVIDAQGLIKSAVLAKLARGKRVGMDRQSARESFAAYFYQQRYFVSKDQHAVIRLRQLLAMTLGYKVPVSQPNYGLTTHWNSLSTSSIESYVMFVHGTSCVSKCWPEEKWIALGQLINQAGYKILLPWGSEEERQRAERIAAPLASAQVLEKMTLTEIKSCLVLAQGVVAVDTGLAHLAAAIGTPTITLYGPTDPGKIGTIGQRQQHVNMQQITSLEVGQQLQALIKKSSD